jgi:hypothetical protein
MLCHVMCCIVLIGIEMASILSALKHIRAYSTMLMRMTPIYFRYYYGTLSLSLLSLLDVMNDMDIICYTV